MAKKVKLEDIAKALNISIVSVSKTLANKGGVSEETKKKILQTAKEMGYIKEVKEKVGVGKKISVVISSRFFSDSSFYSNLYSSLLTHLNDEGYTTILEMISYDNEREDYTPSSFNKETSGIIFIGEIYRPLVDKAIKSEKPFLFLDFYDPDYPDVVSVLSDSLVSSYLLTKHLIDTGAKNIVYVGSINATSSIMDRYLGYCKAMEKAGLGHYISYIEDRDDDGDFVEFNIPNTVPDAYFCNCDEVAFRLIQKLRDLGYMIPNNVQICGFDDSLISRLSSITISTAHVDMDSMTSMATAIISKLINNKNVAKQRTLVPCKIILRDSTK